MPDQLPDPRSGDQRRGHEERTPDTKMPRWVKIFAVVAFVFVVLVVVMTLLSGGHGPGRHAPPPAPGNHVPPPGGHR